MWLALTSPTSPRPWPRAFPAASRTEKSAAAWPKPTLPVTVARLPASLSTPGQASGISSFFSICSM